MAKRTLKKIARFLDDIDTARLRLDELLESTISETEEKLSDMPEAAQEGSRGKALQQALDTLDELREGAVSDLEMATMNAWEILEREGYDHSAT